MYNPIGILDSGVGGLTVWREMVRELPNESTIYIADSANTPYGAKEPEEIYQLAKRLIQFLLRRQVKMIVVACNTITVSCLEQLRTDYPTLPIIGTVPVVKTAAAITTSKQIGVLSTSRTAESEYQKDLINRYASDCQVFSLGTDDLVPLIEKGQLDGNEVTDVVKKVLKPIKQTAVDTVALGCTHFPFIKSAIQQELGPSVHLLDSGGAMARQVHRILEHNSLLTQSNGSPVIVGDEAKYQFFTTGDPAIMMKLLNVLDVNEVVKKMPSVAHLELKNEN